MELLLFIRARRSEEILNDCPPFFDPFSDCPTPMLSSDHHSPPEETENEASDAGNGSNVTTGCCFHQLYGEDFHKTVAGGGGLAGGDGVRR
ncbi:hypothetical protein L1987_60411 [Smallanthus sonchifolius]|uniref:Uncharacterized protein n=1 Tax=Smallanthus sonchifolius TaxID=185202 RepID=A0ACB9D806_9ASTR|nr:hypothetical protein L1987_60411 [Smallanthus sonchifolius]